MGKRSFAVLMAALAASLSVAQGDPAVHRAVIDEGKNRNQVMKHLEHLTKNIGTRLTGSPGLQKACDWTVQKFKEYGLQNVHLEQWGEVPVGFERGKRQIGRMVKPMVRDFEFTSPAWTPGTDGPLTGPAIAEPTTMEEFERVKDRLKTSWMLVRPRPAPARGTTAPAPTDLDKALAEAPMLGRISASTNELVRTSGRFTGLTWENLPTQRRITIRKSDMDAIRESLAKEEPVELMFDMEQRFIKGPIPVYNVIADIPGTEKPDEYVIISGHLDSWDGPGSEGACDNGTGTMVALEAARLLMKAGAKPKRTIRFVLWTGEEQGLLGSRRYVEMHKDKLDKISAVFVDDGGTNYQGGLTCIASMEPMLRQAQEPMTGVFPDMPFKITVAERMPTGGGSDHVPFNRVGVPGFFWFETGRANYQHVHHTQHDKFEEAIPEYLVQSSVNSAIMAYNLACAPSLLPRQTAAGSGGNR
jgi:carboxypeptidase Q